MQICRTITDIRTVRANLSQAGTVGLVTTMGALHAGHMALVAAARADHDSVIATIFVNPSQFGDPADLAAYPRTETTDLAMLRDAGVAAVFMPEAVTIYPPDAETFVETTALANMLHGLVRPGHFRGVATVVNKLFNIIAPDAAYFGEKDYQQLAVIRRMVADLFMPLTIHGVPTVRDADGLALSSRNARLTPGDRAAAPVLHRALLAGGNVIAGGGSVADARNAITATVAAQPRATGLHLDLVDPATFAPLTGSATGPVGVMISAQFGDVLLIDQMEYSA